MTTWADAVLVARLAAADPHGVGGVVVRAGAGPVREAWLAALRVALPSDRPMRRMPGSITDARLLGGLDLPATLAAGRPVAETGLLAETDGGLLVVPMAERLSPGQAARLAAILDTGTVRVERDGLGRCHPARLGVILLDEGQGDGEAVPDALADRLALHIDLTDVPWRDAVPVDDPSHAEASDPGAEDVLGALCRAADALGVVSLRGPLLAARVARLLARLEGRAVPGENDTIRAARLVLGPRATRMPTAEPTPEAAVPEESAPEETTPEPDTPTEHEETSASLDQRMVEAARSALPRDLLSGLIAAGARPRQPRAGKAGAAAASPRAGRPLGARAGDPRQGRLSLVDTLRAAAPWQRLRRTAGEPQGIRIRPEDLRVTRFVQRTQTTTIFAVDASGSAALERLAEAKGAVELLLAEAYIRRDRVAVLAFRGLGAELILPPTRALARARRGLSALPGGGGTPLAAGLDAAAALARSVHRGGGTPVVVVLTDGRANITRAGAAGRTQAGADALAAATALRADGVRTILIDTAARPQDTARRIAEAMGARYLPLPYADAGAMRAAIRAAT
ncbi:magnesium chelatase ATPase subunit D [Methylobacterium sp. Leaf87]|uniref:magnesium chelatase subunit D n=1 Tax=Methylobacterium sp. Leaf87 TaxID=1736243 RepID=UPI0006F8B633|nr:magnesium chelatase subunit D [Methylobacterium sp. Leaf87]KQO56643.1 magnesium chelatase ATPase subunit D [Methylobacterium sp. Leaf87]